MNPLCATLLAAICIQPPYMIIQVQPATHVREVCDTLNTGKFWCHTWELATNGYSFACHIRIPSDVEPWRVAEIEFEERLLCANFEGLEALGVALQGP